MDATYSLVIIAFRTGMSIFTILAYFKPNRFQIIYIYMCVCVCVCVCLFVCLLVCLFD
jgi:hypothetical protein